MALVTPQEVIDYTESSDIKGRSSAKLQTDIIRAEARVRKIFADADKEAIFDAYTSDNVPGGVKTSIILWAEYYAYQAIQTVSSQFQSEQFADDYSYTRRTDFTFAEPDVFPLLAEALANEDGDSPEQGEVRMVIDTF